MFSEAKQELDIGEDITVAIFGTGAFSKEISSRVHNISYYIDNDSSRWGGAFNEKPIYSPQKLLEEDIEKVLIIVASMYYKDISMQLISMGFKEKIHFFHGGDLSHLEKSFIKTTKASLVEIIRVSAFINRITDSCHENMDFYSAYMKFNYVRVKADVAFINKEIQKQSRILNIGGVPPIFEILLKEVGFNNITCIDPNATLFKKFFEDSHISYDEIDLINGNFSEHYSKYDLVCIMEVLEHLGGNILNALEKVTSCVSEDGYLVVTTPNLRSFSGFAALTLNHSGLASKPYDTVRGQYDRSYDKYGYFGHIREYTEQEVVRLIESFGFIHIRSFYQQSYIELNNKGCDMAIKMLEKCYPKLRLFGKYLFKKI